MLCRCLTHKVARVIAYDIAILKEIISTIRKAVESGEKKKKGEKKNGEAFITRITRSFDRELFFHTETVMPLEALPPFAIIVGAITAIGGIQYAAHVLPMGKPKAVGLDNFDRLLEKRDQRIREKSGLQK